MSWIIWIFLKIIFLQQYQIRWKKNFATFLTSNYAFNRGSNLYQKVDLAKLSIKLNWATELVVSGIWSEYFDEFCGHLLLVIWKSRRGEAEFLRNFYWRLRNSLSGRKVDCNFMCLGKAEPFLWIDIMKGL